MLLASAVRALAQQESALDSLRAQARSIRTVERIDASLALIRRYAASDADSAMHYYRALKPVIVDVGNRSWEKAFYESIFELASAAGLELEARFGILGETAAYAEKAGDRHLLLHVNRQLSHLFYHASQLDKSLEFQFLAMRDSRLPGMPPHTRILPYISLAYIYGDRPAGIRYADTAMAMMQAGEAFPPDVRYSLHTHIGAYYRQIGFRERALANFKKACAIAGENASLQEDPFLYLALGKTYMERQEFETAEDYLRRAMAHYENSRRAIHDLKIDIAEAMVDLARITNRDQLAEEYALLIIEHGPDKTYLKPHMVAHRTLYELYAGSLSGRDASQKADFHLEKYFVLRDSLDALEQVNTEYFQTRALELTVKRNQMEVVQTHLKLQTSRVITITAFLIFTSVLLVFLHFSKKKQKRHNIALNTKNKQIEEVNEELVTMNERLIEAKKAAEASDWLKTSILQNMSHEFRTPLTSILGFAEMMGEEEKTREIASQIRRGGQRLMDTLTSVMDLAELEGGCQQLNLQKFDLIEAVREVEEKLKPAAREKGLEINVHACEEQINVRADRAAVIRILCNIVHNAVHFTETGSVALQVQRQREDVVIRVEDSGIGMDPAFLPYAFDPFRQESTGHGRTHEGIGVGLSITKHLVEQMAGFINVVSRKGEGSTFTLTLPIVV